MMNKVARLQSTRTITIGGEENPSITADEVLLRMTRVGVCGSDVHRFRGMTLGGESNAGLVLGHEIAAEIAAVGDNVRHLAVGQSVAVDAAIPCRHCEWCERGFYNLCPHVKFCGAPPTDGALRHFMSWPASACYPLPPGLEPDDGVLAEVLGICLHALDLANMRPAMTAAVLGAGPIGLGVIHLLRRTAGVQWIYASEPISARQAAALQFGADVVFSPDSNNSVDEILQRTNGRGVDVVFECAGKESTSYEAVELAAPGGNVIIIGIPETDSHPFAAASARRKGLTFRFVRRANLAYSRVFSLMQQTIINVRPMITHRFAFENTQKAFELVDAYQDGVLKAVIHFDSQK